MSTRSDISVVTDRNRLRPIDANYQMFDNSKIKGVIDWEPSIPVEKMLQDLLDYWRKEIKRENIPLKR